MIRELFLSDFPLSSCVWQSTIFIVVGLVSSFILRHRSSRAHQVLFLAMIAAVIVPIMSILVKHYELGMFVAEPVVIQSQAEDLAGGSYGAPGIISAENIEHKSGLVEKDLPSAMAGSEIARFPWRSVVLYAWIAASLILATRLVVTFVLGVRLLGRALPLKCGRIEEAVHLARAKLGIDKDVKVRSSRGVRSPVIWCWRRRPVLLVPSAAGRFDNGIDWAGVLCHELAHWKRRDHICGLLAELAVCILPWHPLLWWAKSRLVRLSEQACDDWVVASGQPCTDYAESLLDLTPGGQMAFVPAVVSTKRGLAGRVHRILKDSCGNPRTGALWALAISIMAACLAVGVACAQTRPAKQETTTKHDAKYTKSLIKAAADSDIEQVKSALSTEKLKRFGLAVIMYADDHDKQLPETLEPLKPYIANEQDYLWLLDNVEYVLNEEETKYQPNRPHIPVAYDKTQKDKQSGANVLFMDGHVAFLTPQKINELDMKRAEILIETWFLVVNKDFIENINHNADSPDEAKELFKLKSELLAAVDGSNNLSSIPPERNLSLLLKAVRAHKDSKVLAAPQVICLEGKSAQIKVVKVIPFFTGYTEPNNPSEKPEPKFDQVEEGIVLSLRPNLTPNKNIYMQFEFEITQFLDSEERKFMGKAPYKPPKVQRNVQSFYYRVQNGETFLFGGHKIADQQDGRTEQKDLLVLIKAQTVGSSEQDKPAKTENLIVTEPAIVQSRTERRKDNEQEKTKPATERRRRPARLIDDSLAKVKNKDQVVQKLYALKHHDASQMAQIIRPLLSHTGHISADERANNLLVIDTAENLMRIEKIIAQFDVSKVGQTVTEIFEIRYGDPVEIVELLKKLINGPPGFGSIIEPGKEPIVLVPEPRRKWIIAKASPENIKQIGEWIKKLDISKSIGMDPADAAAYEQLETIVDLSDLTPGMSFGEVVDKLENSIEPPLQIQPIWRDLLENAEVEQATPAGMDPLSRIKLRKALEILLTGVSSIDFAKLTYIVDEGVILIGTVDMLHPRMVHRVYDISDFIENAADADALTRRITETIEPDSWYKLSDKGEGTITPYPLRQPKKLAVMQTYKIHQQITRFLEDTRSSRRELPEPNLTLAPEVPLISNTFIDAPLLDALQYIAAAADVTIIPDETVTGIVSCTLKDVTVETTLDIVLGGTPYVWKKTPYYYLVVSGVEPPEIEKRFESAKKLSNLGKALLIYANDHDDKYPDSLHHLSEYLNVEELKWVLANVKYLAYGKTIAVRPDTVIAYDKMMLAARKGTNVLFNDSHVEFVKPERLKELGISATGIMIETVFLSVSEDYLKDVGLDANTANFSDGWTRLLAAEYPAGPNGQPYGLIIDDLHVRFLLRAVQAHHDSKALVAPRVRTRAGTTAEMGITEEYRYIKGYNEPNSPSEEPQPKRDKVKLGPHIWLTPKLTEDNRRVNLYLKLEMRQLKGIIEGKYKGKYPYYKPIVDVISAKMPCTIPDGKTMLIGGLKINEHIKKEPGTGGMRKLFKEPDAPRLKDLPLIGAAFSSKDKAKDQKMLLILVKPVINPRQKATKLRPGQKDSEEHIKSLARQLEKKLKRPDKPK